MPEALSLVKEKHPANCIKNVSQDGWEGWGRSAVVSRAGEALRDPERPLATGGGRAACCSHPSTSTRGLALVACSLGQRGPSCVTGAGGPKALRERYAKVKGQSCFQSPYQEQPSERAADPPGGQAGGRGGPGALGGGPLLRERGRAGGGSTREEPPRALCQGNEQRRWPSIRCAFLRCRASTSKARGPVTPGQPESPPPHSIRVHAVTRAHAVTRLDAFPCPAPPLLGQD